MASAGRSPELAKEAQLRRVDSKDGGALVGRNGSGDYGGSLVAENTFLPTVPGWGSELTSADLENLAQRWITPELALQMQLRRVANHEAAQILGISRASGHYEGILIPYFWPGKPGPHTYRLRRDRPDIQIEKKWHAQTEEEIPQLARWPE